MKSQSIYNVCFQHGDVEYIWRRYKSYGWARRYLATAGAVIHAHQFDGWAIEREVREQWSNTCVLAQSTSWRHKTRYRNRNDVDRWPVTQ